MQVGKRMMMGGWPKLPYDAEVEYLESTGTQWIDLGFIPQDDTCVECVVGRNPEFHMGVQRAWERKSYRYSEYDRRTYWVYGAVTADYSNALGIMPTIMHDVKIVGPTCYVNGKTSTSRGTTPILCPGNFFYGALNAAGTAFATACFLGPIKIQLGGIYGSTTIDTIPVRFTNELGQSEGAMYDRANPIGGMNPDGSARTDGLYRNRGTGAFTIGPDKTANSGGGGGINV